MIHLDKNHEKGQQRLVSKNEQSFAVSPKTVFTPWKGDKTGLEKQIGQVGFKPRRIVAKILSSGMSSAG